MMTFSGAYQRNGLYCPPAELVSASAVIHSWMLRTSPLRKPVSVAATEDRDDWVPRGMVTSCCVKFTG